MSNCRLDVHIGVDSYVTQGMPYNNNFVKQINKLQDTYVLCIYLDIFFLFKSYPNNLRSLFSNQYPYMIFSFRNNFILIYQVMLKNLV